MRLYGRGETRRERWIIQRVKRKEGGCRGTSYRWILLARSVRKYFRALCDKITAKYQVSP